MSDRQAIAIATKRAVGWSIRIHHHSAEDTIGTEEAVGSWALTWAGTQRRASRMVRRRNRQARLVAANRLAEAMKGVSNAYGCFAGCTGSLPGAPRDGSGHTPACRAARAALADYEGSNP